MTDEYAQPARHSVYVDFDGVVHSYTSGWLGPDVIPDPPVIDVNGVTSISFLNELAETYEVFILTTRARYPEAIPAIHEWLRVNGFQGGCEVTATKGPGIIYIDDRGWRFKGVFPSMRLIKHAYPWRQGETVREAPAVKIQKKNKTIDDLNNKLGKRKFELRELKRAALAVVEYYGVDGVIPPELEQLRVLASPKEKQ